MLHRFLLQVFPLLLTGSSFVCMGSSTVMPLELQVKPVNSIVKIGSLLPLEITLINRGNEKIAVPSEREAPCQFELQSEQHGVFTISEVAYKNATYVHGDPPRAMPFPHKWLAAGESITWRLSG